MNRQKSKPSKTALEKAVDWLSVRDYSEKQLGDKLRRCLYSPSEIETALSKLRARHYLDDEGLCLRQCRLYLQERKNSLLAIRVKLQAKGFSKELVEASLAQMDTDSYGEETALSLLRQHFLRPQTREKYFQYLYRKGFSAADSSRAVRLFMTERQEENADTDEFY